jgi:hypothetical protein
MNVCCCVALIFFDLPFGKKVEHWDERAFTDAELEQMLENIVAINGAKKSVLVLVLDVNDFGRYAKVVKAQGWTNVHKMTWYKTDHNATGVGCYIFATEIIMVCYRPNWHETQWYGMEKNPTKRHDLFALPACSTKTIHTDGVEVNKHQKPTGLIRFFIENHCGPSDFVLVLGFGSGSEIIGAVQSNVNVVGVEQDVRQFNAFRARLLSYEDENEEIAEFVPGADIQVTFDETTTTEKKADTATPKSSTDAPVTVVASEVVPVQTPPTDPAADSSKVVPVPTPTTDPPAKPVEPVESVSCGTCKKSFPKDTVNECSADGNVTCVGCSFIGITPETDKPVLFCSEVCREAMGYPALPA